MRYIPTTINQAELDILNAPFLGGEFAIYMTRVAAVPIADINMTAVATATLTDNAATALPSTGTDLQCAVSSNTLLSTAASVVTFAGTDQADAAITGVATFAPPAWAANAKFDFQRGYAVDFIPSTANTFKTITSLTSVTFGSKNSSFTIWQLPVLTDYTLIGCVEGANWNDRSRMPIGVDCGMESDAFIKRGKSAKAELTIKHKLKGWADGISRFSGMKGTLMALGIKDGQVTSARIVFTQFTAATKFDLPEGEGEATAEGGGKFVEALYFEAGYTP